MERGGKITVGLGILGLGLVGAVPFFRAAPPPVEAPRRNSEDELALRAVPLHVPTEQANSPAVGLYDADATVPAPFSAASDGGLRVSPGLDQFGPPPEFTSTYPEPLVPVTPLAGQPARVPAARRANDTIRPASAESSLVADVESARRHRVIDGDTLARLARKYLGDASRAGEIFDANRNLLSTPEVLPLGVELVIPD